MGYALLGLAANWATVGVATVPAQVPTTECRLERKTTSPLHGKTLCLTKEEWVRYQKDPSQFTLPPEHSNDGSEFMPPAGYDSGSSVARPGVASPIEPGTPRLVRLPDSQLSSLFHPNRGYRRVGDDSGLSLWPTAGAKAKVVGAFGLGEPRGTHLADAWSPGFLPVWLSFSDGRCFLLRADYERGTLSNGRLKRVSCEGKRKFYSEPPPQPNDPFLRLLSASWGYSAWIDPKTGVLTVTVPYQKTFVPLFTTRMKVSAMMAMNSPDAPLGNVTLVGKINGRLTVVTLEVGY